MLNELDLVALTCELPKYNLTAGDVGTVVMVHEGGKGFSVEFANFKGATIVIATVRAEDVRALHEREIANARAVA